MLAALPDAHVLSEPPPVDTVLRMRYAAPNVSQDQLASWVRTIVLALSRPGSRSFYKFDSWSTVDLPLIRRAFPDTPWVFLYREPAEIIASQLRRRGAQMIPGVLPLELFGLGAEAVNLPPEDYCARVVAAILSAALEVRARDPGRSLLANYRTLPAAMLDAIAPLFSLELESCERDAVQGVATRDAKNPALPYDAGHSPPPSPAVVRAATQWAEPLFDQLESARVTAIRLPLEFDADRLAAEVAGLSADEWVPHFNAAYYEGDWSGVSLRSVGGLTKMLFSDPSRKDEFADTELVARFPGMAEAMGRFSARWRPCVCCGWGRTRGSASTRTSISDTTSARSWIHVPVTSNPEVAFYLDGERVDVPARPGISS